MFAWSGVVLALPASTFGANPLAFSALRFLPETAWGGVLMAIGLLQSYAVARNHIHCRRMAALAALFMAASLALLYFLPNPVSIGVPGWGVWAVANAWVVWCLGAGPRPGRGGRAAA